MNEEIEDRNEEDSVATEETVETEAAPEVEPVSELEPAPELEPVPEPAREPEPMQTQYLRLRADFDNFRKRIEREKTQWAKRANERLVEDLLPVLDSFDLGLADAEQQGAKASVLEGFRLVHTMLLNALAKSGLQPVEAQGEPFDANLHQAISRMPSDEVAADQVLIQSRRGYQLGDMLLRPAQVVVSSGPTEGND